MLKLLAIFTVLLSIAQASALVTGKASDPKSGAIANKGADAQKSQHPTQATSPIAVPQQTYSPTFNSAPSPKNGKDGWDKAAILSNYLLVIVGIGGIWVAIRTLKKLERQTKATEDAANAALKQAEIQQESSRPRLTISDFVNNAYQESIQGKRVSIEIKIANSGGMPAYGVIPETWMEFLKRGPIEDPWQFSSNATHYKGTRINIHTGFPQGFQIPFNRSLTNAEIAQMHEAQGTVCFRLRLTYVVFSKECYSDHAFAMTPTAGESIARYTSAN